MENDPNFQNFYFENKQRGENVHQISSYKSQQ